MLDSGRVEKQFPGWRPTHRRRTLILLMISRRSHKNGCHAKPGFYGASAAPQSGVRVHI